MVILGKIEFKILHHLIENDFLHPVPKVNIQQLLKGRAYIQGIDKNENKLLLVIKNLEKKDIIKEYTINDETYYTYTLTGIDEFYKRDINEKDYKAVAYKIITYIRENSIKVDLPALNEYLGESYHQGVEENNLKQKEIYMDFKGYQEMI